MCTWTPTTACRNLKKKEILQVKIVNDSQNSQTHKKTGPLILMQPESFLLKYAGTYETPKWIRKLKPECVMSLCPDTPSCVLHSSFLASLRAGLKTAWPQHLLNLFYYFMNRSVFFCRPSKNRPDFCCPLVSENWCVTIREWEIWIWIWFVWNFWSKIKNSVVLQSKGAI